MISKIVGNFSESYRKLEKRFGFETELKWRNICIIVGSHLLAIYWFFSYGFPVKWQTVAFGLFMSLVSGIGVTCGAHRLWTHRTYKATPALNIFLVMCYSCMGQNPIYIWVRDHRCHHKYSDTDADPHNIRRGFFFSHIGWFMMKHKKEVIEKGRQIDMSDIEADPVLMFERRYSIYLGLLFCHIIPALIGVFVIGEGWRCAVAWLNLLRPLVVLHGEFSVNSFAHTFGYKPYNENILSSENVFVSIFTWGEGWHNYHHTFPFDYKASEFIDFNISMRLINLWAKLGLAYDLREATPELVKAVTKRHQTKDKDDLKLMYNENGNAVDE